MPASPTAKPLDIAIDSGPLHGHRTGVGVAAAGMIEALTARTDVALSPYLVSFRAPSTATQRRLPLPGLLASHVWSRFDRPLADRWLEDADLIHGTNYVVPPTRIPSVVSVYDCWFLAHPDQATPVVRRAGEMLRRAVARGAWVHSSSHATTALVRELLSTDRVRTILLGPPPTDEDASTPIEPIRPIALDDHTISRWPFVLAIGTEERRKDLPLLVQAFDLLASDDPERRLVLAGASGNDSTEVTRAIDALPAAARSRVHRLGVVDEAAKRWLLQNASVLAYPSRDEGFGFPILEAQHAEVAVVAHDVGAVPEIAGDGAALVSDRTPDALAARIREVLSDDDLTRRLVQAGTANLSRFSWADTAQQLTDLYRTALGRDAA